MTRAFQPGFPAGNADGSCTDGTLLSTSGASLRACKNETGEPERLKLGGAVGFTRSENEVLSFGEATGEAE